MNKNKNRHSPNILRRNLFKVGDSIIVFANGFQRGGLLNIPFALEITGQKKLIY